MWDKKINSKLMSLCLCISFLLFCMPTESKRLVAHKERPISSQREVVDDIVHIQLENLISVLPKRASEVISQSLTSRLLENEISSFEEVTLLVKYIEVRQRVQYSLYVILAILIGLYYMRKRVMTYIYHKDGPRSKLPLIA